MLALAELPLINFLMSSLENAIDVDGIVLLMETNPVQVVEGFGGEISDFHKQRRRRFWDFNSQISEARVCWQRLLCYYFRRETREIAKGE